MESPCTHPGVQVGMLSRAALGNVFPRNPFSGGATAEDGFISLLGSHLDMTLSTCRVCIQPNFVILWELEWVCCCSKHEFSFSLVAGWTFVSVCGNQGQEIPQRNNILVFYQRQTTPNLVKALLANFYLSVVDKRRNHKMSLYPKELGRTFLLTGILWECCKAGYPEQSSSSGRSLS